MESAPELITFAERLLKSLSSHDVDSVLDGFSRHPGVLSNGSDPDEWWEGYDKIEAIAKIQWLEIAQLGNTRIDTDEVVAWKDGTVGWISVRGRMSFGQSGPREGSDFHCPRGRCILKGRASRTAQHREQ